MLKIFKEVNVNRVEEQTMKLELRAHTLSEERKVKKKPFLNVISLFSIFVPNCSLRGVIYHRGVFVLFFFVFFYLFIPKHIYM